MPLDKKNVSISFQQGVDSKTDPNQVIAGKLLIAENVVFTEGMAFNKRPGYQSLTDTISVASSGPSAAALAVYKNQLVTMEYDSASSAAFRVLDETNRKNISMGVFSSLDMAVTPVSRSIGQNYNQDSAVNLHTNKAIHAYINSSNAVVSLQYIFTSTVSNQQMGTVHSLPANFIDWVRCFSVGNYLLLVLVNKTTNPFKLVYFAFDTNLNPVGSATGVDIALNVHSTKPRYDGIVVNDKLYLSWNSSDVSRGIRSIIIDKNLNLSAQKAHFGDGASGSINVFADTTKTPIEIWTSYYFEDSPGGISYFVSNGDTLSDITPPTSVVASSPPASAVVGFASSGLGRIYWQMFNTYSYNASYRSDFLKEAKVNDLGVVASTSIIKRGVSLASKAFFNNGIPYFWLNYGGAQGFEPTYFLYNPTNNYIASKLAFTNAGNYCNNFNSSAINPLTLYSSSGIPLASVNDLTQGKFQTDYLFKDQVLSSNLIAGIYSQTGVNSCALNFRQPNSFHTANLGGALNMNSGFLSMYDGNAVNENNFHLFPEDMGFSTSAAVAATPFAAGLNPGSYAYQATYEWIDNQGNTHRSAPSPALNLIVDVATTGINQISIPSYRISSKPNVKIALYRNAPSINTTTFYEVTSDITPLYNDATVDNVNFLDQLRDDQIVGNQILYTIGGVLENTGGPSAVASTVFKNRLMMIPCEDRNTQWYSKQVFPGEPVEMSDLQVQTIDARFGEQTAIAVMDDKEIIFKENAIFYMTGNGPDATGANNDFSEAVLITTTVGTSNPRSIVYTQDGLMFQSNKGIWILTRGLDVQYIGAGVEAFNQYTVTSAVIVPNTTQVRFTLNNGMALVYDYFYQQWATFSGINANSAVIYNGLFTYLQPGGLKSFILQETPGSFEDNGSYIPMRIQTSWLSMAGFQGFTRAYRLYFKGQFVSPHILSVSVGYDYNPNFVQQVNIKPTFLEVPAYGVNPYYGASPIYGGEYSNEQYRVNLIRQKCQALQITIEEQMDPSNISMGAGLTLEAIGALIGLKSTYPRLPATQIVT